MRRNSFTRFAVLVASVLAWLTASAAATIVQEAYLKAFNTEADDWFGFSVAASGDTVVVGARAESSGATGVNGDGNDNSATNSGAAYVFIRNGTNWSQQAYLKAFNTKSNIYFGWSVALSGDTLVVGAPYEDILAGAVYVFVRDGTNWSPQAYLKASNAEGLDGFGRTVSVSGDTIVVGANGEGSDASGVNGNQNNNRASNSGAAYVFVRNGTTWTQEAYLKASNPETFDQFGSVVSVSGDTIVVGAPREKSAATGVNGNQGNNGAQDAGAAYVFVRGGTNWSQQAYLKASNTGAGDSFGFAVAADGDTVVVGALTESSSATGVNGDGSDNSAPSAGAAYVFVRNGTNWSQQAYLKASNTGAGDTFGRTVALSGDIAVIGAYAESSNATGVDGDGSDNSATDAGAAYVFARNGTNWSQQFYLKASNTDAGDEFGLWVAASDNTVAIGARGESSSATGVNPDQNDNSATNSGAAYVFSLSEPSIPSLSISIEGPDIVILFNGTLQSADTVDGAYTNSTATSPFHIPLADASQTKFFRASY